MSHSIQSDEYHQHVDIRQTKLLINGQFCASIQGETFSSVSPVTEKTICDVALASKEDVDLAVKAAKQALQHGPWGKMAARERGKHLFRWAELLENHQEELAKLEVLDTGKPIKDALGDIGGSIETLRYFAGWADKIEGRTIPIGGEYLTYTRKEPVGVCGLIIPWNYPLAMAMW